jgi:hypothetical protein
MSSFSGGKKAATTLSQTTRKPDSSGTLIKPRIA